MATVCLSPHSPPLVRSGHLHAFDRRCAQHQHGERLVWRTRQRHISGLGPRVGCGWMGTEGLTRGGGAMQAVRPAGDGPPKAPRQYIKRRRLIFHCHV
eukprot:scaffold35779_cov69-Phaeocystis_antarctica.AAC.1